MHQALAFLEQVFPGGLVGELSFPEGLEVLGYQEALVEELSFQGEQAGQEEPYL